MSDDVKAAAERIIRACNIVVPEYNRDDSLLSFEADIQTVARFALDGEREVARLRAALREIYDFTNTGWGEVVGVGTEIGAPVHRIARAALAAPTTAGGPADPDSGGRGE